ncbi:MAG: hypothetical protein HGA96_13285 [Desulfobulbaceae bacterium]|nr:hypothetical protein [Desulfobulbaceae bacterium]
MADYSPEMIKRPIMVPVVFAILVFLVASLIMISWLQTRQATEGVRDHIQSTRILYEGALRDEAKLIKALLDFHHNDQQLQKLFLSRNRDALLAYTKPLFAELKQKYDITHFYFIDPEQRCFLRMNAPAKHGDVIQRFTLNQAVKTGRPQSGVDLGYFGNLSLRVDYPWIIDGQLIGYLELGKEVDHFMTNLGGVLGVEVLMLVKTDLLDREKWEEGRRLFGQSGIWEEVPGRVVVGRTIPGIPTELTANLAARDVQQEEVLFNVTFEGRHYRAAITPLFVASGQEVGEIVAMKDFSGVEHSMQMMTTLLVSLVVVMSGFLLVFVYGVISRVEQRLRRSREVLQHEIQERRKAEEQLLSSLNEKQVLLKEIHHRVKNNMQIVCSIFRLQLGKIKDPQAAGILRDSQSRISAMALIHKTLYQPKDQTSIYLEDYIQELAESIFDSYGVAPERIGLKTDLESVAMDIDTVTPLGLILNELITNAIKYAFPEERQGEVSISFHSQEDGYLLIVRDNGVGLPAGLDIQELNSLGLQLVLNLTKKQLGGRLEVESDSGGSSFRIIFRKQPEKSKV